MQPKAYDVNVFFSLSYKEIVENAFNAKCFHSGIENK